MKKILTKIIGASLAIAMMIGVGVGANTNKVATEVDATAYTNLYSADFTTIGNYSYTKNKTVTLSGKSWTISSSQVSGGVFYLGTNSNNAANGVLNNNSTFSAVVTAVKAEDSTYNANYETAHCYALLFNNAYNEVSQVEFTWAGGNNAFQVYLFGDSGNGYELLNKTNYATSGTSVSGSVSWTATEGAVNFTKFAIAARPGATASTAASKTLRASSFTIKKVAGINPTGISLNTNELTLNVCEESQLTATLTPNGAEGNIVWSSDHDDIASVNNGLVTGVAEGSATITATVGNLSASCSVTVNAVPEPEVVTKTIPQFNAVENNAGHAYLVSGTIKEFKNGVKNKYGNLTLTDGQNDLIIYGSTVTASALAWNNGNAYVYTNQEDFITNATSNALGVGSEITMKLIRADYNNTIQGSGVITYIAPVAATAIELDRTTAEIDIGESIALVPSLTPSNATSEITWESSNENIATVTNGTVTGVAAGSVTITAKVTDSIKAECTVTVTNMLKTTMQYTGSTTKNMTATGNASLVGLDADLFTVNADKCGNANFPGLNKDHDIRLYKDNEENSSGNGTEIITTIDSNYTIISIKITCVSGNQSLSVYSGETLVSGDENNIYAINGLSFTLKDTGTETIKISSVVISYRDANSKELVERIETLSALTYDYEQAGDDYTFDNVAIRFGGFMSQALWNEFDVVEFGVFLADAEDLHNSIKAEYGAALELASDDIDGALTILCGEHNGDEDVRRYYGTNPVEATAKQKAFMGVNQEETYYTWTVRKNVTNALTTYYTAVAYIRTATEIIFLDETSESAKHLANASLARTDNADPAYDSLAYFAAH